MKTETHFSLFGLPQKFAIDEAALDKQYLALQLQYHPDRMVGKTPEERTESLRQTMRINDGWHTLKSPLKRALYLLSLHDAEPAKADNALLMEAMEQRERLEDAFTAEQVAALETETKTQLQACIDALEEAFSAGDLAAAAVHVARLQYVEKFLAEVHLKKLKGLAA